MSTTAEIAAEPTTGEFAEGRFIAVSVVVSFLVSFVVIGGALYYWYREVPLALGVGAFASFWGGGGFGVVVGMALYHLRAERRVKS